MRKPWVLALMCLSGVAGATEGERYFVEAEGEIAGKPVSIKCEKFGDKVSREFGDNFFPSPGNVFRSYQLSCMQGAKFAGASFKFRSDRDPALEAIPPFNGTGPDHTWENKSSAFTVRFADGSSQVQVHSFMNSDARGVRQHFIGTPELKITEFKREEVADGKKKRVFHTVAGTLTAEFEEKTIKGKDVGQKGKVTLRFRDRFKEVLDIGSKPPAWPPSS